MTQEQIDKLSVGADILFQRLDGWQDRTLQTIGRRSDRKRRASP